MSSNFVMFFAIYIVLLLTLSLTNCDDQLDVEKAENDVVKKLDQIRQQIDQIKQENARQIDEIRSENRAQSTKFRDELLSQIGSLLSEQLAQLKDDKKPKTINTLKKDGEELLSKKLQKESGTC